MRARSAPVKAPAHVSEQLGLGQRLGDGGHVDGDERPRAPLAGGVDQPGDDLLARAGLAADEHAGVGVGDLVDALEHQPHRRVIADDGDAGRAAARAGRSAPATSSMRSSASSSADVWKGLATTSAAPARSASTAPATEPCAVSASAVTAGRQARAFMITRDALPRRQPQVDDRDREVAATEQRDGARPRSRSGRRRVPSRPRPAPPRR